MSEKTSTIAPNGTTWVCTACGRHGKYREKLGDTSCYTWATLCYEEKSPEGRWLAVNPS